MLEASVCQLYARTWEISVKSHENSEKKLEKLMLKTNEISHGFIEIKFMENSSKFLRKFTQIDRLQSLW